jgi:hypothetical protein
MGFYLLHKGTRDTLDSIRSKFFWQGAKEEHKYHMARWETVGRPKDQGGLGIINTRIMNECLLVKWIWRIVKGSDSLWYKLLQAKYMADNNFFNSKVRGTSQFWQGLHEVKHLFKRGVVYKAKKGDKIHFLEDVWVGNIPLKLQFSDLYNICDDKEALVMDYWGEEGWEIGSRRSLTVRDVEQRGALLSSISNITLSSTSQDELEWGLDKSKIFTTKSLYRFITNRGVVIAEKESI